MQIKTIRTYAVQSEKGTDGKPKVYRIDDIREVYDDVGKDLIAKGFAVEVEVFKSTTDKKEIAELKAKVKELTDTNTALVKEKESTTAELTRLIAENEKLNKELEKKAK